VGELAENIGQSSQIKLAQSGPSSSVDRATAS
jgi:hypothetical protein